MLFQQENVSIHVSKRMQQFFHREGIILLPHPAKSPDFNPIENISRYIKDIVQVRMPQNLDELDRFVQEAFKEIIMPEYCKKLYDSISLFDPGIKFEHHIRKCLKCWGSSIKSKLGY